MREGTRYAAKLKQEYAKIHRVVPSPKVPDPEDPLRGLAIAVLSRDCDAASAAKSVDRLLGEMVDWNEVRVSTPAEINVAMGATAPAGEARAKRLAEALQSVFDAEHRMSLDRLRTLPRREAKAFLERLAGTDPFIVAWVLLWSLEGHAIPVNDALLEALRGADLVHNRADRAEVQAFLERNIPATEAREFCATMHTPAALKHLAAGTKGPAARAPRSRKAKATARTGGGTSKKASSPKATTRDRRRGKQTRARG